MTQQEVKCTPNNQCKCIVSNEKRGMLLREMQNYPSNEKCNHSYMKIWLYTPRICKHYQTAPKQSTKVKRPNALIPKQKIENAMTRTF